MGSAISSNLIWVKRAEIIMSSTSQTQIFKQTTHTPILIDGVKRALNIQSASKERGASFFFPLLAKSKQMWSNLMHALYVGGRVALYALVLVPQHMQQRLQFPVD
jgi:hypothetical protein